MNVLANVGLEYLLWLVDSDTRYKMKTKHADGFTHSEFSKQKNEQKYFYIGFPLAVVLYLPLESVRLLPYIEYIHLPLWVIPWKNQRETLNLSYLVADSARHFSYCSQGWVFYCCNTWECCTPTCEVGKMANIKGVGGKVTEERSTSSFIFIIFICNTLDPSFKLQYYYTQDTVMHNPYFNFLLLQPQLKITILETKVHKKIKCWGQKDGTIPSAGLQKK